MARADNSYALFFFSGIHRDMWLQKAASSFQDTIRGKIKQFTLWSLFILKKAVGWGGGLGGWVVRVRDRMKKELSSKEIF